MSLGYWEKSAIVTVSEEFIKIIFKLELISDNLFLNPKYFYKCTNNV